MPRTILALSAAALGVLICLHQRHFLLTLNDPASFGRMLHHRCGMVLTAAILWAMLECAALVLAQTWTQSARLME